eukprot:scaffold69374_cov39-Attheya_sp.AAC.1
MSQDITCEAQRRGAKNEEKVLDNYMATYMSYFCPFDAVPSPLDLNFHCNIEKYLLMLDRPVIKLKSGVGDSL